MRLLIICMIIILSGCATTQKKPVEFAPDASLLIQCPDLPELKESSMGALLLDSIETSSMYLECKLRMKLWIDSYKKYSGRK